MKNRQLVHVTRLYAGGTLRSKPTQTPLIES